MRKTVFAFIVLLGCALAAIVPHPVRAQTLDLNQIPPLPHYEMSEEDFHAKTLKYVEVPLGDKFLSYVLRLPKDWKKAPEDTSRPMSLDKRLLGDIVRYFGPLDIDTRSDFVIRAAQLDKEITAKNWFINYVLTNGYNLQGLHQVSPKRVEALYVYLDDDTSYIARTVAEINGSRIVMAVYSIPEKDWMANRALQEKVIQSFQLTSPEEKKLETNRTYTFLDLLRFDYPASWRLMAPTIYSIEAMDAKLVSDFNKTALNGEINLHIVSTELDTTLTDEIKVVRKSLEDKGLRIGKLLEQPTDYTLHDHIYFSRVEVYEATDDKKRILDHEYWIAVLMEDRYIYIVSMLTPSRQTDFFTWAMNSEAFREVLESLRP